jgi:hypothetical protein
MNFRDRNYTITSATDATPLPLSLSPGEARLDDYVSSPAVLPDAVSLG